MLIYTRDFMVFYAAIIPICMVIAVGLRHHLKDKPDNVKRIPIVIVGLLTVFFELKKQINNALGFDYSTMISILMDKRQPFSKAALPFYFCSFFIFYQIAVMVTKGKTKKILETISFIWATLISTFMILYPDLIWGGAITDKARGGYPYIEHTLIYHFLALLYFFMECGLHISEFKASKWYYGLIAFCIFMSVCIPASFILNENYTSVLEPQIEIGFLYDVIEVSYVFYELILAAFGSILCMIIYYSIIGIRKLETFFDSFSSKIGLLAFSGLLFPLTMALNPNTFNEKLFLPFMIGLMLVCLIPSLVIGIIKRKKQA